MVRGGNLKFLIPLAIAASIATIVLYQRQERGSREAFEPRKLLPDLDIGAIRRVEISVGDESYALVGAEDRWSLDELPGFPIDAERLRQLILGVGGLEASDRMTEKPENYERLGVQDEKPAGGHVRLLAADGKVLADVFVGEERRGKPTAPGGYSPADGQYVRIAGDPWVYKTADVLTVDSKPKLWLKQEILKVPEADLQTVRVDDAGGTESFTISRTGAAPFQLEGGAPEGMTVKDWAVENVARALSNLTLSDVLSADAGTSSSMAFSGKYRATQKNGLTYEVGTARTGDKYYARVGAAYEPSLNLALSDERTSDTVQAKSMDDPEAVAVKLREQHAPWIYEISEFAWESLAKKRSDLLEPVRKEAPAPDGGGESELSDEAMQDLMRQMQGGPAGQP